MDKTVQPENAERFLAYIRLYFPDKLEKTFLAGEGSPPNFNRSENAWRTRYPGAAHLALFVYRAEVGVEHHSLEKVIEDTRPGVAGRNRIEAIKDQFDGFLTEGNTIDERTITDMCRGLEATVEQTETLLNFANKLGSKPVKEVRANAIYEQLAAANKVYTAPPSTTTPPASQDAVIHPRPEDVPHGWQPYELPGRKTGRVESNPPPNRLTRWLHVGLPTFALLVVVLIVFVGTARSREMRGQAFPESGFTPVISDPPSRATTTMPSAPRPNAEGQPLEFTVEPYPQGSCGAYVFPGVKEPVALGSPPSYNEDFSQWLNKLGGVSTSWPAGNFGAGLVLITLQAPTAKKVVVTGVRAEVVEHGGPADGVMIKNPCGSNTPGRAVKFDGDTQPPAIVSSTDGMAEVNGVDVRTEQLTLPIQVSAEEPETLYVTMTTTGSIQWKLHLDWSAGMDRGTTTFDNYGQPFRTAATIAGARAYTFTDAGWNPK